MSVDYLIVPNDKYTEDVAIVAPGSVLVGQACQVWQVLVIADIAQSGVIEFSDDAAAYTGTDRKFKVYLAAGQYTQSITFPHGLNCKKGLCAISNISSIDVFVSYD
jgi:hypothetical protein